MEEHSSVIRNFISRQMGIILALFALVLRLPVALSIKTVMWDAAAYLMNAKWFLGDKIYIEILRAPILPLMISGLYSLGLTSQVTMILFSVIVSSISVYVTYLLAEKLFGKKVAIASALVLAVLPLHFLWSPLIYTEIPASIMVMLSLFVMWESRKNEKLEYLSIFIGSLAFLTRYPTAPLVPALVLYLILQKRMTVKKFCLMFLIGSLPVMLWSAYNYLEFGDPFITYKQGIMWSGQPSPWMFYFTTLPLSLSVFILLILPGSINVYKKIKEGRVQLLLIPLLMFLLTSFIIMHKEERFLLPFIPVLVILSLSFIENMSWKKILLFLVPVLVVCSVHTFIQEDVFLATNRCDGIINSSSNLSGNVASAYWTQTAYYGHVKSYAMPADPDGLHQWLSQMNISYILTSSRAGWPEYGSNFTFFDGQDYLSNYKSVDDGCQKFEVYKVTG